MINHEEMSERKLKILHAIIQNYLETGEPVGSRTISKYTDLNLSSATIRNEMADLEEMGYIIQPHTSAGRIPSDKGYRLYVDMLMEEKEQELNEMQDQMLDKADKMDQLLKQAAKVLATNTNYATMVSTPMNNSNKIKFIQLSMVDEEQVIAVIVLGGNVIKNKIINIDEPISNVKAEYAAEYNTQRHVDRRNQPGIDRQIKGAGRNPQSGSRICTGCSCRCDSCR